MKFKENPYYYPEKCGLEIFDEIDTAPSYEFALFVIWKKLDDGTLWWDQDFGCSCPTPFDNLDHGHDMTQITKELWHGFEMAINNHDYIGQENARNMIIKVKDYLGI